MRAVSRGPKQWGCARQRDIACGAAASNTEESFILTAPMRDTICDAETPDAADITGIVQ